MHPGTAKLLSLWLCSAFKMINCVKHINLHVESFVMYIAAVAFDPVMIVLRIFTSVWVTTLLGIILNLE